MAFRLSPCMLAATAAFAGSTSGYAVTYLTTGQAQTALFPGVTLTAVPRTLTAGESAAIEQSSGMRVRTRALRAWRAPDGAWLMVDEVLGKHEFITYAVALTPAGAVRQIEIMDYRETYGGEVRNEKWRSQFAGKTASSPLRLDHDIKNISGATLSCRHVTDGVKRLLATHALVLRTLR